MGKLSTAQSHVYTLTETRTCARILTQKDDEWEQWRLEDLTDNLKRFAERNPLTTNEHLKDGLTNHYGQFESNRNMEKGDTLLLAKRHNQDKSFKQNVCTVIWTNIDPLNA